jgi:hypothetical protein
VGVVVRYRNIFGSECGYGNLKWRRKLRKKGKEVSGNDQNKNGKT